jgi:hypothetical protein
VPVVLCLSLIKSRGVSSRPPHRRHRTGRTIMYSTLRRIAWAAVLSAGSLLLFGAATARADGAKREKESTRSEQKSRESTRRGHRDHAQQTAGSHESGRKRMHAAGGRHGSRGRGAAIASGEHSRGHRGHGRWAAAEGHRGRGATHHRVSMHSKHGRSGRHGGNDAHSSRGGRSHWESRRSSGQSGHGSSAHHGRGSHRHSRHHRSTSRSHRDS